MNAIISYVQPKVESINAENNTIEHEIKFNSNSVDYSKNRIRNIDWNFKTLNLMLSELFVVQKKNENAYKEVKTIS